MGVKKIVSKIMSYIILLGVLGFIVIFALIKSNIIENPFGIKALLISFSQSQVSIKRNNSIQLVATVYPESASSKEIVYTSDKPEIVEVNRVTGHVSAKNNGVAIITAHLSSNKDIKAECTVTVSDNSIHINRIILNTKQINLLVGKTFSLNYRISPPNATIYDIEYESSNPNVAIVENGKITAKSPGRAVIVVRDKISNIEESSNVIVYEKNSSDPGNDSNPGPKVSEVKSISVDKKDVNLAVGGKVKINVTIQPNDANKNVTWQSLDSSIASVDSIGNITGKKVGSTKIVVTSVNGKEAYVNVRVGNDSVAVTGIKVKESNINLNVRNKKKIDYTIIPSNATNQAVTITSSNENIVTIDHDYIKAIKEGNCDVTVKTQDGGYEAKIHVTVNKPSVVIDETDVVLSKTSINLKVRESTTVTATVLPSNATYKSVTWSSTNNSVATVKNGLIVGVGKGTAEIVATTVNRKISKKLTVTVSEIAVSKITLNKSSASMKVGDKLSLVSTISPSNASNKNVTWTSSNNSIATVSSVGVVTAKAAGTVTITVKTNNGKTATCKITITKKSGSTPPTQSAKAVEIMNPAVKEFYKNYNTVANIKNVKKVYNDYKCNSKDNICWWPNSNVTSLTGDIKVYDQNKKHLLTINKSKLANVLIPGNYYYLEQGNTTEYIKVNANAYRMIKIQDVPNVRDLGGKSASGGRIKYGLLFRGANPNINGPEAASVLKQIGVNTVVDLRLDNTEELKAKKIKEDKKPLNDSKITKVTKGVKSYPHETGKSDDYARATVKYIMQRIVDGKKIYFHCAVGKDRTGTVAYLLQAILGVDDINLIKDYSLSYFKYSESTGDSLHYDKYDAFVNYISKHNGSSTEAKAINWFIKNSSNKSSDISLVNKFRSKMINGSPASYKLDSNGNAVKSTSGTPTNPPSTDSKKQKIHFIKQAGAGDAILLESNGHFAMIDVGVPGSNNDCSIVTNYLKNNNVSKLDFILITHAHNDHMGCGESVISKYSVSNLYIKELYSNGKNVSKTIKNQYNNLINTAKNKKITINYVNRDSNSDTYVKSLKMGDMSIKLYNTKQRMDKSPWNGNNELYNNENNNSIMALVTINSKKTFLTGDMEDVNIMKKIVPDLVKSIDVLKLPHHGKGAKEEKDQGFTICGLNKSLLNNLKPSYLVATNTSKKVFDDAYSCFNQAGFKKVDNRTYTKGKNAFAVQDYSKAVIFDYSSSSVSASTK